MTECRVGRNTEIIEMWVGGLHLAPLQMWESVGIGMHRVEECGHQSSGTSEQWCIRAAARPEIWEVCSLGI